MTGVPDSVLWAILSVAEKQGWEFVSVQRTTGPLAIKNNGIVIAQASINKHGEFSMTSLFGHTIDKIRIA
jgi:hypothetical protein